MVDDRAPDAAAKPRRRVEIVATITRADGTVEELGVVSTTRDAQDPIAERRA